MAIVAQPPDQDKQILQQQGDAPVVPPVDPVDAQKMQAQAEADQELEEDELKRIITALFKVAEDEDLDLRVSLINIAQRNELYFNNIQNIVLDPIARDYKTISSVIDELAKQGVNTDVKTINIYRAYAESIIAALSVEVPAVEFAPDDADSPDDLETSDAYQRISVIIQKHNKSPLLLIKALTILYNQGVIFGHNTYKRDPAFGMVSKPKSIKQVEKPVSDLRCGQCGELLDSSVPDDIVAQNSTVTCRSCGYQGPPDVIQRLTFVDEVVEWENTPKGKSKFAIYGATRVKAPLYAKNQDEVGYLILRDEGHIAKFRTEYDDPDLTAGGSQTDKYERWGRLPLEYRDGLPKDITTVRYGYFRPWFYNVLSEDDAQVLFTKFPNGFKATAINEEILESSNCKLDDEWTISFDPRADFIHAEPAGNQAIPIQDAENDLFNLGIQSIEYGIPETFVDPKTLRLSMYKDGQSSPGMMTAAKPPAADKSLADGFHTVKPATLSNEYTTFASNLQSLGQLVTGALPSLYGGTSPSGSRTAAEYGQSRSQALQRCQIPWRSVKVFWSALIYKSVRDYANNLLEDEKHSDKQNGNYVNVWIRKSQLTGKVGQVEPDLDEELPQSWGQVRDFITKLIELNNPEVGAILLHPNNSEVIKQYAAIPQLYIPGENDRNKQYTEFQSMVQGQQVHIDIVVDDHAVHMQVLKNILVSPVGMNLEPQVYAECIQHYKEHELATQAKTAAPSGNTPAGVPPASATGTVEG